MLNAVCLRHGQWVPAPIKARRKTQTLLEFTQEKTLVQKALSTELFFGDYFIPG